MSATEDKKTGNGTLPQLDSFTIEIRSDDEVDPNHLLLTCHPNDLNHLRELLREGVVLKDFPRTVDDLLSMIKRAG